MRCAEAVLTAVFLERARWGDRSLAQPVDQSGTSPLRPPVVRTSDAEVVSFVAARSGAVGYVSELID
jgi:hypothetical protein